MKYWSSSRVGAVPHPPQGQSTNKQQQKDQKGNRYGRKKGITMEDLKKQTALRLAQEQKQNQNLADGSGTFSGRASTGTVAPQQSLAPAVRLSGTTRVSGPPYVSGAPLHGDRLNLAGNHGAATPTSYVRQQQHAGGLQVPHQHHTAQPVAHVSSENVRPSPHQFDPAYRGPPPPSVPSTVGAMAGDTQLSMSSAATYVADAPEQKQQRHIPVTSSNSSSFDSTSIQKQSKSKSKLPHGLTVSELKEMTKARLQAEAAAEKEAARSSLSPAPPGPSASGGTPGMYDYRGRVGSVVSPLPPTMQQQPPLRARTHSQGFDAWSQDGGRSDRTETWETGSVSTAASDYLGSDCAYGINSYGIDEPPPSPYALQTGTLQPPEDVTLHPSSASGYHIDDSANPSSGFMMNRRRAATLSPRQGLGFLDERHEQEFHPDGRHEMPSMPSFAANRRGNYPTPSRHSATGILPPINNGMNNMAGTNRARASSAASLPGMSHTADEFLAACDQSPLHSSFHRIPSLREDAPSPSVTGLADVFRESPITFASSVRVPPGLGGHTDHLPRASAPTGLGLRTGLGSVDSFGGDDVDILGDPRGRAATWAGSTADSIFGPGLIGRGQQQDASFCEDLATILKLSGCSDEDKAGQVYPPPGL